MAAEIYYPPAPTYPFYDPNVPDGGTPVQFEMVPTDTSGNKVVGLINPPSSNGGTGLYDQPAGVTFPVYTPPGPWGTTADGLSIIAFAGASIISIDSVIATENRDGTGQSFQFKDSTFLFTGGPGLSDGLVHVIPFGGVHFSNAGVTFTILDIPPDPPALYLQSVLMTGYRQYEVLGANHIPPNPPPSVTGGNTLDAANPGFTAELHRDLNYWDDLVEVFLGQRVNLTVESEGSRLGFHGRGHIITIVEMDMKSELSGGVKIETIDWTYTVEKIPGTLLPGAGTSTPAQDALGTGAEIPLFAIISTDVPTIGVSNLG